MSQVLIAMTGMRMNQKQFSISVQADEQNRIVRWTTWKIVDGVAVDETSTELYTGEETGDAIASIVSYELKAWIKGASND
jgi:hypothetical protein